ncbi:rubredoxin-oxygen oxidoreductase [Kipferlia bialata]|uniref:Rubredoxin-oxygen oxidoreductase n=1 Tax=Kipferlia bialata TaxID=797122 RepID=A0A9K3CT20_9EUKA|nr:rubredoxin-oxygen oxidoreductase [Kipferlia bialata]|eukprot:g2915.t1
MVFFVTRNTMATAVTQAKKVASLTGGGSLWWVGGQDWDARDWHGFQIEGTTYGAYLIESQGDCVLIDTVKASFADELLDRVRSVVKLEDVSRLLVLHSEPDHTSGVNHVLEHLPNAKVTCGKKTRQLMQAQYSLDRECQILEHDDTLTVGNATLKFGKVPMLHWPDSSYAYLMEDKVLFSNDAFGQHFCGDYPFCDQHDRSHVSREMNSYAANILTPFTGEKGTMNKGLTRVLATTGGEISTICPSHGVMFRTPEDVQMALERYTSYANQTQIRPKVLVLYDSMYGHTVTIARAIEEGVYSTGAEVKLMHTRHTATEAFDSACVAIGSPTLNMTVMPSVHSTLGYLKGLELLKNKPVAAFGCYGWSINNIKEMHKLLGDAKGEVLEDLAVKQLWAASGDTLASARDLGIELGKRALSKCKKE